MGRKPLSTIDIQNAVGRGALYADIHHGKWGQTVKIEQINVASPLTSVMAQLNGRDWDETFSYKEALGFGFILPWDATPAEVEHANKMWKVEVRRRRTARKGRPAKSAPVMEEVE